MSPDHDLAMNETKLRVRYAETDQMGVVYHSNHLIWFEVGRVELMRQLGFSYRDMERDDDRFIAVVDVKCRYRAPVFYDEEVLVRTHLMVLWGIVGSVVIGLMVAPGLAMTENRLGGTLWPIPPTQVTLSPMASKSDGAFRLC